MRNSREMYQSFVEQYNLIEGELKKRINKANKKKKVTGVAK